MFLLEYSFTTFLSYCLNRISFCLQFVNRQLLLQTKIITLIQHPCCFPTHQQSLFTSMPFCFT